MAQQIQKTDYSNIELWNTNIDAQMMWLTKNPENYGVIVAGNMFDRHILDYYRSGLGDIRQRGIYETLNENSRPYLVAVWKNFSTRQETITEGLISGKLFVRGWQALRRWYRQRSAKAAAKKKSRPLEKEVSHDESQES